MLNGTTFGLVNGIITMLSLLTGLYATKVNKIGIIGAILAMIISDPLCDAYAIYIAQKEDNKDLSPSSAINAFLSQVSLQILFLIIIIIVPNVRYGLYFCYLAGLIITICYSFIKNVTFYDTILNITMIAILIMLTFGIDKFVYHFFNKSKKVKK